VTRIISALVLLPLVLAAIFLLPAWGTLALALVVLVAAVWELASLAERPGEPQPRTIMIVGAVGTLLSVGTVGWFSVDVPLLAALVALGCVLVGEARTDADVLRRVGVALLPMIYVALPLGAMVAIRRDRGPTVLLLLLATTMVSDTAQFYGGRSLGKRRLAPAISPKKTVEGAITGLLVGGAVLPIGGLAVLPGVPLWVLWPAGLVLVGLGIVGDLFESLLKRSAGVKDSSAIIPGHGGVLDRVDSLLFTAPFYYGFLKAMA
jgi:phosphatidate cytidylyltransferase